MMGGNWGKVLKIDLGNKKFEEVTIEEKIYRDFLGGSGLAAKLFFDSKGWEADPLSPDNPLMVMLGPISGLNLPGVSRLEICARSPLTGIWGEACMGGHFAPQLKGTGYDGIILTGASDKPIYLMVTEAGPEFRDASHLWGKDTYDTEALLKEEVKDKRTQVICIGPAGENLVKYANVMNDQGSTAGRCGIGAVMGSKKLKAIVASGKKKAPVADQEALKEVRERANKTLKFSLVAEGLRSFGSNLHMGYGMAIGDVPIKNWQEASWDDGPNKLGGTAVAKTILAKKHSCYGCPIACKRIVKVDSGKFSIKEGPGSEFEAASALGTLQCIGDVEANNKANELCNRYGMDVISAGSTIAYAIEANENGILPKKVTKEVSLRWNDPEGLLELIKKIAYRDGIGDMLAEGTRAISEKYGGKEYAIHVKGLECPMHDPRSLWGMALTYATSVRGACHCADSNLYCDLGLISHKELGIKRSWPFKIKGKAQQTIGSQIKGSIANSAILCEYVGTNLEGIKDIVDILNAATGFRYTVSDLAKVGDRIWYLKRAIGNLCGATREDDKLPQRILEPHKIGTTSNLTKVIFPTFMTMKPTGKLMKMLGNEKVMNVVRTVENKILFPSLYSLLKPLMYFPGFQGGKKKSKAKVGTVPFDEMIEEFYRLRDIDAKGRPGRRRLEFLGLKDVADALF